MVAEIYAVIVLDDVSVFQLVGRYSDKFQGGSCGLDQFDSWTQAGDGKGSGEVPSETSRRQVHVQCTVW